MPNSWTSGSCCFGPAAAIHNYRQLGDPKNCRITGLAGGASVLTRQIDHDIISGSRFCVRTGFSSRERRMGSPFLREQSKHAVLTTIRRRISALRLPEIHQPSHYSFLPSFLPCCQHWAQTQTQGRKAAVSKKDETDCTRNVERHVSLHQRLQSYRCRSRESAAKSPSALHSFSSLQPARVSIRALDQPRF